MRDVEPGSICNSCEEMGLVRSAPCSPLTDSIPLSSSHEMVQESTDTH